MPGIDVKNHLGMIYSLLAEHDFPPGNFSLSPGIESPGMSLEGKIIIRETIGEHEAMPIYPVPEETLNLLIRDHAKRIACLVLHEIFHCRHHFKPFSELSIEERLANDEEADNWALVQIGLI